MTVLPYYPEDSAEAYKRYYSEQVGNGFQVFQGAPIQRGHGIGSFLGGLAKASMPLLKNIGGKLLKTAATTGVRTVSDIIGGKSIKDAALSNVKAAGGELFNDLTSSILGGRTHASSPTGQRSRRKNKRKATSVADTLKRTKTNPKKKRVSLLRNVVAT